MWHDFLTAVALVFVIEGIFPFLNPAGFKRMMQTVSDINQRNIRWWGLLAMATGLVMLYLVR
tara:strand:+ start:10179 stop:10364 length:186 start_codon:yes stop_codon:yes gene_type:complete